MRILQINMFDTFGGAEKVAWDLHRSYQSRGCDSWIGVGRRRSADPRVRVIPNHWTKAAWPRFWWGAHHRLQPYYGRVAGTRLLCRLLHALAEPEAIIERQRGIEDFNYPGTWSLPEILPQSPDVIHCHNLHQKYFDLRALPWLSQQFPVFLTLHDAWLLSGHCAHSFDCERWRSGCGHCPDLSIHPAVRRDATAFNWQRKRALYAQSRLYIATPCRWLLDKVKDSILAAGMVEARIIPYGVDLTIFKRESKQDARSSLSIPPAAAVLMFAASGIRRNAWKDYQTMRQVVERLAARLASRPLLFMAVGEDSPPERCGGAEIRFVPFQSDPAAMARYYQAADIYIHCAKADTFPCTILEAMACGTPVVATAVGGIPEQVRALAFPANSTTESLPTAAIGEATGILVPPGDAAGMASAVDFLLRDEALQHRLGDNAASEARRRFDLRREADDYLDWYRTCVSSGKPGHPCIAVQGKDE